MLKMPNFDAMFTHVLADSISFCFQFMKEQSLFNILCKKLEVYMGSVIITLILKKPFISNCADFRNSVRNGSSQRAVMPVGCPFTHTYAIISGAEKMFYIRFFYFISFSVIVGPSPIDTSYFFTSPTPLLNRCWSQALVFVNFFFICLAVPILKVIH